MSQNNGALPDFLAELRRRSHGDVRTDDYSRILYSTDASIYQVMPHGVMIPASMQDVHAAVTLGAEYGIQLLPRTGGSSLAGQAVGEALVMDFTRHLDGVMELNVEDRWVRVQPGIVLDRLNQYLQPHGLQFGPDPASSNRAAMGGIVSNNSTGSHSVCYGMTVDHLLAASVILSDGSRTCLGPVEATELKHWRTRTGLEGAIYDGIAALVADNCNANTIRNGTPRHWRRCGGYNLDRFVDRGINYKGKNDSRFNLANLVCGAEGTLAVIEDVTLRLVPVPQCKALAIVHFDNLTEALSAVPVVLETRPSAIELLDNLGMRLCRDVPKYARLLRTFVDGEPDCVLITEFYGESADELQSTVARLGEHLRRHHTGRVLPVLDPLRQRDVWTVRKVGLGLLMSIKGDHKPIPFIEDAAVPTEHLADYVAKIDAFCKSLDTRVAYYGHASAGCVHIRPLINTKVARELEKIPEIMHFTVELLHGFDGALSSEHGDGRVRSWLNERFFGPELYRLYQEVKRTFDPQNILNPGNVVNAPPVDKNLRYGTEYAVMDLPVHLDFSGDLGFDRAVEMCNGAGICRKTTAGTMCPSFMATREEEHSTRGRANALRAALSGKLPHDELTSRRMYDVMDLCIECKACKAECPSSVDMAKIKFEFLARYHARHGVPLRSRLFGNIASISRIGSGPWAGMLNRLASSRPARMGMEAAFGVSRYRTMPAFAAEPFTSWFKKHRSAGGEKVVLFHDTFNTYSEPDVARSAVEVLEAAGMAVVLPGHRCCGRPMISKGMVRQARAAARHTVDCLSPFVEAGTPIVGLEPSCLLTMNDEYLYLLPGDRKAQRLAEHVELFEDFITRLGRDRRLSYLFTDAQANVLLHAHCHQKALVGSEPSLEALSLPPGYRVQEVDSGCCGMAGSFGYEKEHYAISVRMAEHRLLPAIRQQAAGTIIAAVGTSCRHQIKDGTGVQALHPAQILRRALRA